MKFAGEPLDCHNNYKVLIEKVFVNDLSHSKGRGPTFSQFFNQIAGRCLDVLSLAEIA